jgi:hypothetical protein
MLTRFVAALLIGVFVGRYGMCQSVVSPVPAAPVRKATKPRAKPCVSEVKTRGLPHEIFVEDPKTYDDAVLQQQLESNFARLSVLSGLDQSSLTSHLGNVSGVDQTYSSGSLNIQGPGTNQVASTAAIPNTQTVQTNTVSSGMAASGGVSSPVSNDQKNTQTTTNAATDSTTTTRPSFAVPVSAAPAAPTAITSGFSVQSSAVLSEQLQLVSRLNTQLLEYEGALSDRMLRYLEGEDLKFAMRPRATIGFDVTVAPVRMERDSVAVVEVIVSNCEQLGDGPPAVTAILPSEKTFNVAAVRNTSTSLGGGVATQFVGASGSFLFGHNQYFLVQDQDTIAQVFDPSPDDTRRYCPQSCVGVRWIFRPVLGKRYVGPERRKIVAQIAFPVTKSTNQLGLMTVRTMWRQFDRKTGLVGGELSGKGATLYSYNVLPYPLDDIKPTLSVDSWDDLGSGLVSVRIADSFLPGTYIQIGNAILSDLSSGLVRETGAVRFAAPAIDLLSKNAFLVSRSGDRVPLIIDRRFRPELVQPSVSALDATFSHLVVSYCQPVSGDAHEPASGNETDPMFLVIAGKVYGLSDAPLDRTQIPQNADVCAKVAAPPPTDPTDPKSIEGKVYFKTLGLTIPTATLLASPVVTMKPMLADKESTFRRPLLGGNKLSALSQSDRLVALKLTKDNGEFLLYGNRLSLVKQVEPTVTLDEIAGVNAEPDTADNMRYVTLTAQQLEQYKFLVITRKGEAPEAIAIPPVTLPGSPAAPVVTGTVLLNQDSAVVTGTFQDLEKVYFKGIEISVVFLDKEKKSIKLVGLKEAGVTSYAGLQSLDFTFKTKPIPVKVDVFTQTVQTTPRPVPDAKP